MFGDSVFEEEDDRPSPAPGASADDRFGDDEEPQVMAFGGLDERVRRLEAVAQLLREVGGC